jgi:hypothetical protein
VRLGADPPDFELLIGRRIRQCEAVEVLAPGRLRGAELRAERTLPSPGLTPWPESEWVQGGEALDHLRTQLAKKVGKAYAPGMTLVVYLNLGFLRDEEVFRAGVSDVARAALSSFEAIWLLRRGEIQIVGRG